ncbi:Uncharacterised protein [Enterobacter cloacae]|nr:Uncharacterised protein [Enterobacter cloacae]
MVGAQAAALQLFDAERRGQAGGAEDHRLAQAQALRALDHPGRGHADVLAETAGGVHAQVVAGDDHLVTGRELGHRGLGDHTGGIDAGGMRVLAGHPAVAAGGQRILVVQRGILHADQYVARRQVAGIALDHLRFVNAVGRFRHPQRLEYSHFDLLS